MDSTIRTVKQTGHIINPYGLKITIPKSSAYVGTNYMVQGTAAYIQKRALVRLSRMARDEFPGNMYLLLNIHDETMLEVSTKVHSQETIRRVSEVMGTDSITLGCPCPFPVGMKVATERWSLATEMETAA
jgi:DNA polymerase I-like protein with 3'-5' exonuclease and polymerase domains